MKKILWFHTLTIISAINLSIFNLPGNWQIQAQTLASTTKIKYIAPVVQEQPGEPKGRRRGGGSRGPCKQYETLTALVPVTKTENKDIVWGNSASQTPTFWFFVPDKLTPKVPVEFVIQDEADNYVYQTKFNPPETPAGVISLAVKPTVPLETGKSYRWTFSISCDPDKPSASVYVRGSMTQIALNSNLKKQLETAKTPLEKAVIFAENGIWQDALTTLGEQMQNSKPIDPEITSVWAELLKQVNLDNSASASIVPCCTTKQ
ncbi:DUF928 domain-containing protein [Anabaena cylindrica FACHB-243]|uniref:DUF928 domain-containing protein n=1 Tax=Anabaena cylindrica (strain ATCC 27899 / PCC 7122) TaxID=272123 RepID=K9Z9E0_ANACC|nr:MULTISPECIES: DUF928 domain-containing protein [Anabaena]AFZ55781.1 protein of unknown function DUF928 [Anabaena cylindrica PCC 7122]MBD2420218.1 DUF928 domain-containing protein [Anabaena cylindrica FACHB-243]MBY5283089.1 DUF928 domain-containing protein [Anabaena sp. CCAP 1446/1C]MBY5307806.1 DUF928 domain-containing protein [Anabaena sp. CCAP 1446/1C]MCM2406130.1 DUF928 domain-containing protein [Anabaena sp. CCAP 1446/1C]